MDKWTVVCEAEIITQHTAAKLARATNYGYQVMANGSYSQIKETADILNGR